MFKKFFVGFLSFLIVFINFLALSSSASDFPASSEYFPENYNPVSCADFDDFANSQKYSSLNLRSSDFHYIILYQRYGNFDILSRCFAWSSDFDYTLDVSDGVYTFTFSCPESNPYSYDLGCICREGTSNFDFNGQGYAVSKLVYDSNSFTFDFLFANGSRDVYYTDAFAYRTNLFQDSNELNVVVDFTPDLVGDVDRSYTTPDGLSSMLSILRMTVTNNSSFPIQYRMSIYKVNQTTFRDGHDSWDASIKFDDDPVFMYYSNSWVYSTKITNEADFWNELPEKQFKSSNWHYVSSGSSDDVIFKYSQIDLKEGEQYQVLVDAIRCDYGFASEQIVYLASRDPAYSDLFQIQGDDITTVYDSTFSMIQYSDVVYDPSDQSNGVNPFSGLYDGHRYAVSYEAKENDDGSVDYNSVSLVDDTNSWAYKQHADAIANANRIRQSSYSSGNGSFDRLNSSFSDYFKFLNTALGYFPSVILTLITLGLTTLVMIGIIKAVIR